MKPLITQFNEFVSEKYYQDGFSKEEMPRPYRVTSRHLNLATDKKTYAFQVPPTKDLRFDLGVDVVSGIKNSLKGNVIREKLLTLTHQPQFEQMLLSYLFGAYIGSLPPDSRGFLFKPINLTGPKAQMIKSLLTTRTTLSVPFTLFKNLRPKLVLLGYIENSPDYRVSGDSVVVTNSQRISQLIIDNGWAYTDAGKLLIIPDAFSLLKDVSKFSFEMFIDIDQTLKEIMTLIAGSKSEKINIKDLDSFIKFYPGFIFHSVIGDTYPFSDYQSWELNTFVRGRQNEGTAFRLVDDYMRDLIKHLGLYESEYETAHVLIGSTHYDIPILSLDLGYIMWQIFKAGTEPVDKPAYRVWDSRMIELKETLTDFFEKQLQKLRRNDDDM